MSEDLHYVDGENKKIEMHGAIDHGKCIILLRADEDYEFTKCTLLHEIVHGIIKQAGLTEHDEANVIALGYGLVGLLKQNPDLFWYLTSKEEPVDEKASDNAKDNNSDDSNKKI
jgi:hypothetical protein